MEATVGYLGHDALTDVVGWFIREWDSLLLAGLTV
jgi:hypothetical protein